MGDLCGNHNVHNNMIQFNMIKFVTCHHVYDYCILKHPTFVALGGMM
jgi:hypothetical protein